MTCVYKCTDRIGVLFSNGTRWEYRAYIVGMDGRVVRAVELLCPDDDTAKEYAKNLVDGHDVELWQDRRKIAKFDHKPQ